MKKRILSLLLVLVMVLGMFPVSAMATNESRQDTVYISVSYDGQYINDAAGTPVAYLPVSLSALQAIDLASYGLSEYDYNGQLTALHLYIYTHEKIMGKDWDDVGVSGGAGSIFFENGLFGFQDCNLQYYYNGKYPEVDSWGVTADQLVLNSGDFFDIAAYTSWAFYSDSAFGFHYFLNNEEITHDYTATAGETLTVTLGRGASFMGSGSSMTKVAGYTVSYGAALGTATGTVTTDSDGTAEITFTEAGTYYLWVDGGYGNEYSTAIVSSPGYAEVTVVAATCTHETWNDATCKAPKTCANCGATEGEVNPDAHSYVSGTCEYCCEADPNAQPTTYAVTLPSEPVGYTIAAEEGSVSPVTEGSSYSFTVTITDGYEPGENFAVKANDVELTDVEGVYTIANITADQTVTVTGVVEENNLAAENVTIIAPAGSTISSGRFYSYFKYDFNEALETTTLEDGRISAIFPVPSSQGFLRVQHPKGVTYWDFDGLSAGSVFEITEEMLFIGNTEYTKETVYPNFEKNKYDKADLYLTVNAQGWLDMDSGDIHSLNVFRNWLALGNSIENTSVALPDVEYKVVSIDGTPSDVVTVTPNENNSSYADIKAENPGTAIILVSYDAVYNNDGLGGKQFSAIWPENTGVIVVTVDADDAAITTNMTVNEEANTGGKQIIDVEHDILFYIDNVGAEYSFKPEEGCTVSVARSTVGETMTFSGFSSTGITTAEDGTVTVTGLTTGNHIIKVEKDGKAVYQVIRARQVSYELIGSDGVAINAENLAEPGETITVQFHDLISPMEKLSGVYNANFGFWYNNDESGIEIRTGGGMGMYDFNGNEARQKFTVTVPSYWNEDTFTLTDGAIKIGGFGDSFGKHRSTSYLAGKEVNTNASGVGGVLSVLPDITIPTKPTGINVYWVTLPTGEGYTVTSGATPVTEGGSYTFNVTVKGSYDGNGMVVKVNGETVTGIDGSYTVENVSSDLDITIEGVTKITVETPTEVTTVYANGTDGSNWPYSRGYIDTVALGGVTVESYVWDGNTCTVTLDESTPVNAPVTFVITTGGVLAARQTATLNGTDISADAPCSVTLVGGKATVGLYAKMHTYSGTKTFVLTIAEPDPEPTTYTVTLPTGTGYTVTAGEGSTSPVTEGGSYSFTVTVAEGYETGENFAVKANGTTLTAVEDVYTISNITADQTITVEGVVEKPVVEKLTVTVNVAPSTASVTFYSVEIFAVELAAEDIADNGVVGNYHQYVLTVAAGTYSYRGMDSEQYLGGMNFTVDAENTAFNLRRVNYYGNKNATANVGDYTLTLEDAVCGTQYVDSSRGAVTPVLLIARGSSQKYTPAVNLSDTVAENYIIKSISQTSVSMSTSAQNASFSLTSLLTHTITAPADAVVKVFNQTKNYVVENVAATGTTTNTDGTVTTAFKIPAGSSYSYRVSKEGKITYAGYLNSTTADAIVVNYENSPSPTTTESTASNKESSVLVNVNGQNDMTLAVGETFRLRAFRAWQIVNTVTANIMIEPDYHYTVLSGAEHIELVPVTDKCTGSAGSGINSNWIDIRGISEGTAVVEVSYDAIVVGSSVYGATAPARKMLVVIHVGGTETTAFITADGFAEPWDAEFDTVYFTESTGTLTFSAVVGDRAAKTVALSTDNGSTWTDLSSEGGKYTASGLVEGCNLLKLTADGITEYQVVRAAKISYTITRDGTALTEDDRIQVGDELVIAFDGLFTPVPKMSGIYNPGYVGWPADKVANGHKMVYTVPEGWTASNAFSQYDFATNNAYTVTVGTAVDAVLSGGYIKFNNMGDPAGAHRNLTDEGRTVNTTASNAYYTRCVLPDILIAAAPAAYTVTLPTETTGYTVTETEGSTFPVVEGGSYSFTVTIADGYEAGENFAIKANDDELTDVEGVYTISNITADQTVTVEGVVEKQEEPALTWQEVMAKTKAYLTAQVEEKAPVVASQKGEWVVLGLARDGVPTDSEFFNTYYENVVAYVDSKINAENGRLHAQKSTDNSRVILALSALGKDVTNVGGHNLLQGLSDTAYVRNQGINGPVWALIALDSRNYDIPVNADSSRQVTREWLISHILENELPGGGWALSGQIPDDMTPMAVQALAPYYDSNADVNVAVDRALMVMETMTATTETYAQIIVARSTLGLDSEAVIDNMLTYALGDGRFEKGHGSGANQMSTEQAFYAMVAYERYLNDENSLYDMSDVVIDDGNGGDTPDDPENPDEPDNPGGGDEPEDDEEEKLIFGLSQDEIAGWVIVSFEDKGVRRNEELSDIEPQFRKPLGSIVPMTRVPFRIGDTIAAVTIRLLEEKGLTACYQGDAFGGFYLEAIGNFTIKGTYYESFGEFDAGVDSGWMITWDDWFINEGASEFTVENNDLVKWQYTCQLGEDIGDPYWGEGSGGGSAEDEEDEEENEDEAGSATEATKADEVFSDVKGHWGSEAINYVYEKGLMNGVSDTEFAPDAPLNRAMLVTILYRMAGEPEVSGVSEFDDVSADTWYSKAVIWAAANGIVDGVSDTEFAPTKNITREQMAVMLMRYANYMCYSMATNGDVSSYADSGSISAWAKAAVEWANAEGLINGRTEDTIVPGGTATRAEAATILMRFLESIAK